MEVRSAKQKTRRHQYDQYQMVKMIYLTQKRKDLERELEDLQAKVKEKEESYTNNLMMIKSRQSRVEDFNKQNAYMKKIHLFDELIEFIY